MTENYKKKTQEKYGQKFSIFALLIVLFILVLVMYMCVRSCRKRNARKRAQMVCLKKLFFINFS